MTDTLLEHRDWVWVNRALKATKIADWITVEIHKGDLTFSEIRKWSDYEWKIAAKMVGKDEPSRAGKILVQRILEQRFKVKL